MALSFWADVKPHEPAIISPHGQRSFEELNTKANQLVNALRQRGVAPGDGVVLLSGNRPEFAEVFAATQRSGLRLTPVNWHLTVDEIGYISADSGSRVLIADARFGEAACAVAAQVGRANLSISIAGPIQGFESYDQLVSAQDGSDIGDPTLGRTMLYTSGTTGRPKGVSRPPGAASVTSAKQLVDATTKATAGGRPMDLCTGPLYHSAPLVFSLLLPLVQGRGIVMMDGWDAEETLRLVERHRITHTHMVPTMFHRLLCLPEVVRASYDTSSLQFVIHGAAPCPQGVKRAVIDWWGPIVYEYYAATEGAGTFISSEEWLAKPGSVGKPSSPDHVSILDPDGNTCAADEVGMIYLKAPKGQEFTYHNDATKTASVYRGSYYTLGDMGYLDADGYLFLTDRSVDLIISGGVNIYPAEVESALLAHPAVADVAVIGIPNDEWGEEVKAVVELRSGVEGLPELAAALIDWCRDRVAAFKCPRTVDFRSSLPRQENGKLYKEVLRQEYRSR